jgi:hypothetical protein
MSLVGTSTGGPPIGSNTAILLKWPSVKKGTPVGRGQAEGGRTPEIRWVCKYPGLLCSRVSAKKSGNMGVFAQKNPKKGQLHAKKCEKNTTKRRIIWFALGDFA